MASRTIVAWAKTRKRRSPSTPGLAHLGPSHLFTRIHNTISWSRFVLSPSEVFAREEAMLTPCHFSRNILANSLLWTTIFTQLLAPPKMHFPQPQLDQSIDGALEIFAGCSRCLHSRLLLSPCELVGYCQYSFYSWGMKKPGAIPAKA